MNFQLDNQLITVMSVSDWIELSGWTSEREREGARGREGMKKKSIINFRPKLVRWLPCSINVIAIAIGIAIAIPLSRYRNVNQPAFFHTGNNKTGWTIANGKLIQIIDKQAFYTKTFCMMFSFVLCWFFMNYSNYVINMEFHQAVIMLKIAI